MNRIHWSFFLLLALLVPATVCIAAGGVTLPPDPGEAGKQTLLGIDSDGDGVRDDIQRWIYLTYPDDEKLRLALLQAARGFQQILAQADDPAATRALAEQAGRDLDCLFYIIKGDEVVYISRELEARILNTRERSLAYLTYDKHLAGKVIDDPPDNGRHGCTFDVDAVGGGQ